MSKKKPNLNQVNTLPKSQEKALRAKSALVNLFIGDALSMPVHWFYNPFHILKAFPPNGIQKMQAAPKYHPSSIMNLHSTTSGGRKNKKNEASIEVVGEVILKDKAHLWGKSNIHYHHGMKAGENTLNAWCAKYLMNILSKNGFYDCDNWLKQYVSFMTSKTPLHPDTYAESYHRGFFANYVKGKDLKNCAAKTHDIPSMGALVTIAPLALALLQTKSLEDVQKQCKEHILLTHPSKTLLKVIDAYVLLIQTLLNRPKNESDEFIQEAIIKAASAIAGTKLKDLLNSNKQDSYVLGHKYSLACYITDSWPSVCYLAAKYYKNPKKALLTNTNLGGENAHRGSVLGTLVGLASGEFDESFYKSLAKYNELELEINTYLNRFNF